MNYKFNSLIFLTLAFSQTSYSSEDSLKRLLDGSAQIPTSEVMEHLERFQQIANENEGNRSSSTPGHELSANYISQQLLRAGYDVELIPYTYSQYEQVGAASLAQTAPTQIDYKEKDEFQIMPYSLSGDVSGEVEGVDLKLGLGNTSDSGCEPEDFKDFTAGKIALLQRGACTFSIKAQNAQDAGAIAVIIFNQGDDETRKEAFAGTLGNSSKATISVATLSYDLGAALAQTKGAIVSLKAQTKISDSVSYNVVAETKSGNPDNIVVLGSHLDGVHEGPGINDNGSGSAGILAVALRMANMKLTNKVRFGWWGSEELGLIGSTKYVEGLSDTEKNKIRAYLNFDMIASPNYMIGLFDGNGTAGEFVAPKGSASIEKLTRTYFEMQGQSYIELEASGRSDYAAFSDAGIPYGGLFTGAEGKKTAEQAALFGGIEGEAYDSCYHQSCDTIDNISQEALAINVNAIAFMALSLSYSTLDIEAEQNGTLVESDLLAGGTNGASAGSDVGHDLHDH